MGHDAQIQAAYNPVTKEYDYESTFRHVKPYIEKADIAILLVSPYFLASDFIATHELPPLLESAKKKGLKIIWIAVSASLYKKTEISEYQAANDPNEPLDTLSPPRQNQVLVKICEDIESVLFK